MPDDLAPMHAAPENVDWRHHGIRVIARDKKCSDTPGTLGMNRMAAISGSLTGSARLWAGTNLIRPNSQTGPHHHGPLESIIYVIYGEAQMRWGNRLEFITKAGPGDFFQVPAWMPHQEINAGSSDLHCVLVRSGPEEVVVNIDVDAVVDPEWVFFD